MDFRQLLIFPQHQDVGTSTVVSFFFLMARETSYGPVGSGGNSMVDAGADLGGVMVFGLICCNICLRHS